MALNLQIKGLDAKLKFFDTIQKNLQEDVGKEIKAWSANTAADAVTLAPKDEGFLRNSIKPDYSDLVGKVTVGADYGAYLEFGTRKFAAQYVSSLPDTWQEFATNFKGGGGGTFADLVKRITEWVHRKGLGSGFVGRIGITGTYSVKTRKRTGSSQDKEDRQAAYLIARKIVREGIPAQPYLFPAERKNTPILIENIKRITGAKYIKIT